MAEDLNPSNGSSGSLEKDEADAKSAKNWMSSILATEKKSPEPEPEPPKRGTATMPVDKDDDEYNMNHKFRGKALIFNHKTFKVDGLSVRNGTDMDRDNLADTLAKLDFQVEIYNDLPRYKLFQVISDVSGEDHSDADCLVIAVFSHGVPNKIYASDESYERDNLWDPFTAERCPTLAGKPKIFFIQACQGEKLDGGIQLLPKTFKSMTVVDSATPKCEAYKIPNRADFFMAFSTYPGYYSWRNTTQGSWFIQSLFKVFNKNGHHQAFMSLMTVVARKVALEFESFVPYSEMDQQKQVVFITSTLIREIYFRPKQSTGISIGSIKTMTRKSSPIRSSLMRVRTSSKNHGDSGNEDYTLVNQASLVRPTEKYNNSSSPPITD